jgi:hypothetical protein
MRRRDVLFGTTPLFAGVAGCSGLLSDSSMLSLAIFNHSDNPYTVEMTLLRSDEDASRSEARVFSESIDVEPDGQTVREDVAEVQPYIIEYGLYEDNSVLTDQDHVHYFPADENEDDSQAFDIDPSGVLTRR